MQPANDRGFGLHRVISLASPFTHCIYNVDAVFDWDENNLRKIRAHRIRRGDVEQALSNSPILIYEQQVEGEPRFVYYGETEFASLLRTSLMPGRRRITIRGVLEGNKR